MRESVGRCPHCGSDLEEGNKDGLTVWQCSNGHGVGVYLTEAYGHFQDDEIEAIREALATAPRSSLVSPISGELMAEVSFMADDDNFVGNAGVNARSMTIEVDRDNYFGWFTIDGLQSMPLDGDRVGKHPRGLVGLDQIDESSDERFFDRLTSEDYQDDDGRGGVGGLFAGLARRLRS